MATITVTGLGDEEKAVVEQAANEANMDLAEFARHRLRAGYRLWDADENFDVEKFQEKVGEKEPADTSTTQTPKSVNVSKEDRFAKQIKRNLPTEEEDALGKEEIAKLVSTKVIASVISDLIDEGEVKHSVEYGGYVRAE